nr:integrase core domain-containing protein [Parasedimentitalea psychrophila]
MTIIRCPAGACKACCREGTNSSWKRHGTGRVPLSEHCCAMPCWATSNRMIERLWRSLKYECIYLNAFETGSEARLGIGKWLAYYNAERPHSTHGILTPKEAYETKKTPMRLAA